MTTLGTRKSVRKKEIEKFLKTLLIYFRGVMNLDLNSIIVFY